MRALPNMTVLCPADADEMRRVMEQTLDLPGPAYIRLGKGGDPIVSREESGFSLGRGILMREPGDALLVTTGIMLQRALAAAEILDARGIHVGILHLHTVKPFDVDALLSATAHVRLVVTVEEHVRNGGLGAAVLEALHDNLESGVPRVLRLSLPDEFMHSYGSQETLLQQHGLTAESIASSIGLALSSRAPRLAAARA
jgi:transketolase